VHSAHISGSGFIDVADSLCCIGYLLHVSYRSDPKCCLNINACLPREDAAPSFAVGNNQTMPTPSKRVSLTIDH
jgi:hypothetical protein